MNLHSELNPLLEFRKFKNILFFFSFLVFAIWSVYSLGMGKENLKEKKKFLGEVRSCKKRSFFFCFPFVIERDTLNQVL